MSAARGRCCHHRHQPEVHRGLEGADAVLARDALLVLSTIPSSRSPPTRRSIESAGATRRAIRRFDFLRHDAAETATLTNCPMRSAESSRLFATRVRARRRLAEDRSASLRNPKSRHGARR